MCAELNYLISSKHSITTLLFLFVFEFQIVLRKTERRRKEEKNGTAEFGDLQC